MKIGRQHLSILGTVQGTGFRPFVYNLAVEHNLKGWVKNQAEGVAIEIEGRVSDLEKFQILLKAKRPVHSKIREIKVTELPPINKKRSTFIIKESDTRGGSNLCFLPDTATCDACIQEIFDPSHRRYLYPFNTCAHCGPRYSILEKASFDRQNTSMRHFLMCAKCQSEYENPKDRRFHAQTISCPECGPSLRLLDNNGNVIISELESMQIIKKTAEAIYAGKIVAVKGIGGFQLLVSAVSQKAIKRLREKKGRESKPFAILFPDEKSVVLDYFLSSLEKEILTSSEAPIVLLKRKHLTSSNSISMPLKQSKYLHISSEVAPHLSYHGALLPYSPIHHMLMRELKIPIIATSGNLSDEPICIQNNECLTHLKEVVDLFLVHNRDIMRPLDDSVVKVIGGKVTVLRKARGYTPMPVYSKKKLPPLLAVGGELKNSVAIGSEHEIILSQHIGDLKTRKSMNVFEQAINDLSQLTQIKPKIVLRDLHPSYESSKWAEKNYPTQKVQHHVAHLFSCMAEHQLNDSVLGVCWDGTGYGEDGTVWGGEFFLWRPEWKPNKRLKRFGHLLPFLLLGGSQAIREPRRIARALLLHTLDTFNTMKTNNVDGSLRNELENLINMQKRKGLFTSEEIKLFDRMFERGVSSPRCSSIGRLFDGIASLLDLCHVNHYEGEAAMQLETLAEKSDVQSYYPVRIENEDDKWIVDYRPIIKGMVNDLNTSHSKADCARRFHNTLRNIILEIAALSEQKNIVLSGGVFQNKLLSEIVVSALEKERYTVYQHHMIPPNDGGIALGQIYYWSLIKSEKSESLQRREYVLGNTWSNQVDL